jgi:hypothetical protein
VINMNQQSDSTDLLGGYKPVDISHTMHNILQSFTKAIQLLNGYPSWYLKINVAFIQIFIIFFPQDFVPDFLRLNFY